MHILQIQILSEDPEVIEYYHNLAKQETLDSGRDIIFPETISITEKTQLVKLGIKCQLKCTHLDVKDIINNGNICNAKHGYFLMPRSSIYKSFIRQSNSFGLIDSQYSGELCVAVDSHFPPDHTCPQVVKGTRLFQLVMPDTTPFKVEIVNELTSTQRGEEGFGSTGK